MRILLSLVIFLSLLNPAQAEEAAADGKDFLYFVTFGRVADVKLLIEQGADPNALDPQGWPMLSVAVSRKDEEMLPIAEALIDAGAKVSEGGPYGFYPLGVAIERDNAKAVKLLLEKEANWQVKYRGKDPIVDLGKASSNAEISKMIQEVENEYLKEQAYLTSDANRIRLLGDYMLAECGKHYWEFFISNLASSGEQQAAMQKHVHNQREKTAYIIKEMSSVPKTLEEGKLKKLSRLTKTEVHNNLRPLIETKNPNLSQLVSDADMEKRCKVITAPWYKWVGYYDFNGLGLARPPKSQFYP